MILSTHAIVGGAIAGLFPSHPVLVAAAAFASHFAIDAIPHWDYPLHAISVRPAAGSRALKLDRRLWGDLSVIALDACAKVGVATIRRVETIEGEIPVTAANEAALRAALESAGVEFINENGVRLRKSPKQKR
jgi:hypothetical protein